MDIMDDVLDLMDSLGETLEKGKRKAKRLLRGESGFSTLVTVLVILALGSIIITPLLVLVVTGQRAGSTHNRITHTFYAADTGIQDGMWRVSSGDLPDWMKGTWNNAVYTHAPLEYTLPNQVNGNDVTVKIGAIWLLEGLETPAYGREPHQELVTVSNIVGGGHMQIVIVADSPGNYKLDRIGVWIPQGFTYTMGSSTLEKLPTSNPAHCVPTVSEWKNGHTVIFDYGTAVDFADFPGVSGNRMVISFDYTPGTGAMTTSWSWCRTNRHDIYLSYSGDIKMYQIESTATDPVTGHSTTVIAGNMTNESVGTYLAYYGDYAATGNAFLRDTDGDDMRDRAYLNSPGQISTIPDSATPRKVLLYWSGWKDHLRDVTGADEATLQALATDAGVKQVSLTVKLTPTSTPVDLGTVTASECTVVADELQGTPDGWSYSCRADITDLLTTRFGSSYFGNATYTVGHAELGGDSVAANTMQGIWGTSATNVITVGLAGSIINYDGYSWNPVSPAPTGRNLNSVWGSSASNVYVVGAGYKSGSNYYYTIERYNGTSWSNLDRSSGSSPIKNLNGVWGSGSGNIIMVGSAGTILRYNGGSTWNTRTSGTTYDLYSIWGSGATNVFAVGAHGTILRSTDGAGASWSARTSGTTYDLYSIWGSGATNVFAAGAHGTILRSTDGAGASWNGMTTNTTEDIRSVWGSSASNAYYAVGARGTILYWDGNVSHAWTPMTSGVSTRLNSVWGSSSSDVYAVGDAGVILHYDGSTWSVVAGRYSLFGWVNGHSGEAVAERTDCRLGDNAPLDSKNPDMYWNLCSGAWSIIVLYTSPVTLAHQMYLYDKFEYCDSRGHLQYDLSGFLAPAGVGNENDAVRLTCFVSEGDEAYSPDTIWLKTGTQAWTKLNNGTSGSALDPSNVWNGISSSGGTAGYPPDCVDIDTFSVTKGYVKAADSEASVWAGDNPTVTTGSGSGYDAWNMVYIILSFRSDIVGSGLVSYIVK